MPLSAIRLSKSLPSRTGDGSGCSAHAVLNALPAFAEASAGSFRLPPKTGGDERARTANLRLAKPALSQLSYVPGSRSQTLETGN